MGTNLNKDKAKMWTISNAIQSNINEVSATIWNQKSNLKPGSCQEKKLKLLFVLCSETNNKTDWEQKSLDKAIG